MEGQDILGNVKGMKMMLKLLGNEETLREKVEAAWEVSASSTSRWEALVSLHNTLLAKVNLNLKKNVNLNLCTGEDDYFEFWYSEQSSNQQPTLFCGPAFFFLSFSHNYDYNVFFFLNPVIKTNLE